MAITLYDPNSKRFRAYDPKINNAQYEVDVLLLNILLELRVQTEYLAANVQGLIVDEPEQLRASFVSE